MSCEGFSTATGKQNAYRANRTLMNLKDQQQHWTEFGRQDPYWAVLSESSKKGNKWNLDEFYREGEVEIQKVHSYLHSMASPIRYRRALDFGCGVGRLSQPLCAVFQEVCGVDISPSMIDLANARNRHPDRCFYHHNARPDLTLFPSDHFDFVYSNLTLQHIEPRFTKQYLKEFIRILAPGGCLIFQLPSHRIGTVEPGVFGTLKGMLRRVCPPSFVAVYHNWKLSLWGVPTFLVYGIQREEVEATLRETGQHSIEVLPDSSVGPRWVSFRYVVRKQDAGS